MLIALGVSLCAIIVAPWIGRWRANLWLRRLFASAQDQSGRNVAHPAQAVQLAHARMPQPR